MKKIFLNLFIIIGLTLTMVKPAFAEVFDYVGTDFDWLLKEKKELQTFSTPCFRKDT